VNSVRELILQRAGSGSQPGQRTDHARLALCVEGGAMRGVVSAGMVIGLERLGLLHVFDDVYGASAGALNGAYFVGGKAVFGTAIYSEEINNRRFINPWRMLWRPAVDIDYLVNRVLRVTKPLPIGPILASPIPLHVIVTDVATAAPRPISSWPDGESLLRTLRGGATMPVLAGPPFEVDGHRVWDPAFFEESIPIAPADAGGATHLLVLLTRPRGTRRPALSAFDRFYVVPRIRRVSPPLADAYVTRDVAYARVMDQIETGRSAGGAHVLALRPTCPRVSKMERDRVRLVRAAEDGIRAVEALFGSSRDAEIVEGGTT
jgi:predicted patatin/cPLA2 family phospholipase